MTHEDKSGTATRDAARPADGRGRLKLVAQGAITAGLLAAVLYRVDWPRLAHSWKETHGGFAALAGLAFLEIAALEVVRLRLVLTPFALGWWELVRLHTIGVFCGNFLPGQLGADLYKVAVLRPLGGGAARPLALFVLLRVIALAVLLAVALAGAPLYAETLRCGGLEWRAAPALLAVALLASGALTLAALCAARPTLRARLRARTSQWLAQTRQALTTVSAAAKAGLFAVSWLVLAARAASFYWLTAAVGSPIALGDVLFVVVLATLVTVLPISFAGLGLREGAVVVLLTQLAVSYERAVLVAFLGRALVVLLSLVGGAWLLSGNLARRGRITAVG